MDKLGDSGQIESSGGVRMTYKIRKYNTPLIFLISSPNMDQLNIPSSNSLYLVQ